MERRPAKTAGFGSGLHQRQRFGHRLERLPLGIHSKDQRDNSAEAGDETEQEQEPHRGRQARDPAAIRYTVPTPPTCAEVLWNS